MIQTISTFAVLFVAIEHFGFLVLEMFFWTKPIGLKIFRNKKDFAEQSRVLAANQGLYNGFLAAGLLWSVATPDPEYSIATARFFLACVIVAGIYGGFSVNKRIFFVQALPAILAFVLVAAA